MEMVMEYIDERKIIAVLCDEMYKAGIPKNSRVEVSKFNGRSKVKLAAKIGASIKKVTSAKEY